MKTNRTWKYLAMLAVVGVWGCSTSRQTAQNVGEVDDLYGNSSDAVVYASANSTPAERPIRERQDRYNRNSNPDYVASDEQRGYDNTDAEYYSDLSTRKLKRGITADPGWSSDYAYNNGFSDGYNMAAMNNWRWNRWGWNSSPLWGGFQLGMGIGMGMSPFGMGYSPFGFNRFGSFYDPFYGGYAFNSFYDPFWGSRMYDPFYGGGYYGYNSFYNPYYGYGAYNRPLYVTNNVLVNGTNPYVREGSRTYGARNGGSSDRYNGTFTNAPRTTPSTNGGRRSGEVYNQSYSGGNTSTNNNSGNYARERQNSRGSYYYENPSSGAGRTAGDAGSYTTPGNSSGGEYYARPRQNSRGSYNTPSDNGSRYNSGRSSYESPRYEAPRQQPTYQQPSYQSQSRGSDSWSSPSSGSRGSGGYSAPSSSGGGGGGSYSGGGSRGPR